MPTYDGITLSICVDDTDLLPEFMVEKDLTDTAEKKVSCWVPSQLGKGFVIIADNERQKDAWSAEVKADGVTVCRPLVCQPGKQAFTFKETSTTSRAFTFAKIELVDDDSLLGSSQVHQIGKIEVKCCNVQPGGWRLSTKQLGPYETLPGKKTLHERSKKGIGEHISLGREVVHPPMSTYIVRPAEHIVTFVFYYRPLDFLQAQGIAPLPTPPLAPRSPPPVHALKQEEDVKCWHEVKEEEFNELSAEVNNQDEGDVDEEIKALLARVEELKAQKRKQSQINGSVRKKVKKEQQPQFALGKIIDLT